MTQIFTDFPTVNKYKCKNRVVIAYFLLGIKVGSIRYIRDKCLLYFLCLKICFLIDNHCKRLNVFSDLLIFTQGTEVAI